MSTIPTPDAKAVVRALEALTTQVRRIADIRQNDFVLSADATDDDATTPAVEECNERGPWGDAHACFQPAGHHGAHEALDGCQWKAATFPFSRDREQAPATDEDGLHIARRRDSLLNLLDRLDRHGTLTDEERALLRRQVQDEGIEADTARHVAAGNKRHVQVMHAELEQANEAARRALEQRQAMAEERYALQEQRDTADRVRAEVQRDRDQHAAVLTDVLGQFTMQTGDPDDPRVRTPWLPTSTVDRWRSVVAPTVERPWWETLAEARAELGEAQDAIERVRALVAGIAHPTSAGIRDYDLGRQEMATAVVLALTEPEQPTTKEN